MTRDVFVYCVFDIEAEVWDIPFFARSDLFASRRFVMDIKNRTESMVHSFKESFELYCIAKFDQDSAVLEPITYKLIVAGKDVEL